MRLLKFSRVLLFLTVTQLFANSSAFFFPLFSNFLSRFNRNNHNDNHFGDGRTNGGGVSMFRTAADASTGTGNVTTIPVPMLHTGAQRRVDVVTTLLGNGNDTEPLSTSLSLSSLSNQHIEIHSNVTTGASNSSSPADQQVLSTKLIIPTSTSVTSSISASQHGVPMFLNNGQNFRNTLTLPFTPNLFGMMSYVQAMKDIKRNYKDQEKERKLMFHHKDGGDLMTRILRTLIQKVVHKHQKHTELLKLKILKRQDKLQNFLQLPMVSQVIAMDQARAASNNGERVQSIHLGNRGAGVLVPQQQGATQVVSSVSRSGNPVHSVLSSFLI